MTDKTKQKIMDTALTVFAEEGYVGAKTRIIAEKSGFSEMTLFRKFETKENLFNMVLIKNQELILEDITSMFPDEKFESPGDCFKALIYSVLNLIENNYEYVSIFINERRRISETTIELFITRLSQYIEKMFPDHKVDAKVFAFNILSFLYFVVFDKKQGRTFVDHKKAVDEFINYSSNCLKE